MRTKNEELWKKSASGGAFGEICKAYAMQDKENTLIYGACFDGTYVMHCGTDIDNIGIFHKSKYVQSDLKNCFAEIKEALVNGNRVLFSGTPCQVAGLKKLVGADNKKLFCVDLICHGVGSPKVFEKYLSELENAGGKKIESYTFRVKKIIKGYLARHNSQITFSDGSCNYVTVDYYNKLFLSQLCLRDCCGEDCRYRNSDRTGDITIADFNNFNYVFPRIYDKKSYSTVVVNNKKGEEFYNNLADKVFSYQCSIEDIEKNNPLFCKTTPENPLRKDFYKDFADGCSIAELCDKYVPKHKKTLKVFLHKRTPYFIKHLLLQLTRMMKKS